MPDDEKKLQVLDSQIKRWTLFIEKFENEPRVSELVETRKKQRDEFRKEKIEVIRRLMTRKED